VPGVRTVDEIPVAHTPPGGYGDTLPAPVLAGCTTPVAAGAPDLAGLWRITSVTVGDAPVDDHPMLGRLERIEQAGDRVVIANSGVVHDLRADGTEANGVHDVAAFDFATPIVVVGTFERDGGVTSLVLRPAGIPGVEVRRWRDGDALVWSYAGMFTARLARVD
jgi:hypothetical protein